MVQAFGSTVRVVMLHTAPAGAARARDGVARRPVFRSALSGDVFARDVVVLRVVCDRRMCSRCGAKSRTVVLGSAKG